jgi:hypothetical protein
MQTKAPEFKFPVIIAKNAQNHQRFIDTNSSREPSFNAD